MTHLLEAQLAIKSGASILGLVGNMPSGPGIISDKLIRQIAAAVPAYIETFLLTSETSTDAIIAHHRRTKTSAIQIVDKITRGSYIDLWESLPDVKLIQVIHVVDEESIAEAKRIAKYVDAILLDSGNPNLKVKELGGTGRTHNWEISKKIVEAVHVPVYLAGGLKAENVATAIERVQPYGVDLCSGVRTNGQLDEEKLNTFFRKINDSNDALNHPKITRRIDCGLKTVD